MGVLMRQKEPGPRRTALQLHFVQERGLYILA